ncbi:uncharacterized protein N7459_001083 [Penicillium hispanicum]|uniref:uncharacterized protein n=1 Tax=Penicillium hispanicum TaxID=1080232 RepID=UPI0025422312|nr:uncharacterized protein N7459_001083 [Penicillium hispanicum]KAJ5594875.1 hypothetical protein N7459_001083 [Penicillium hispanicum]
MPQDESETIEDDNLHSQTSSLPRRQLTLSAWLDHFNMRDLKPVFRCWVAIWVSSLLMFIRPSFDSVGIATFFGPLVLYLMPPAGVLSLYLLGAFSLLVGMCSAWVWGLLTMKAARAARPDSQTQALVQRLEQQAIVQSHHSDKSVSWIAEKLVREGFMLDARVTVIFYVMSCVFVYTMARIRVANPKFAPGEVFGNIVMDLFLLYGPTLPSFTAELGKVLVLPGAIGIGLGIVSCILLFPQSTSHAVLEKMDDIVSMGRKSLRFTRARLAGVPVELSQLQSTRAKTIAVFKTMQSMLAFLPLDLSRGRWSAEDVHSLNGPMRQLMTAQLALLDFHIARVEFEHKVDNVASGQVQSEGSAEQRPCGIGHRQFQETANVMLAWKAPDVGVLRSHTAESLNRCTAEVLQVYSEALGIIAESFQYVNSHRWFPWTSPEQFDRILTQGEQILDRLRSARSTSATETTNQLIECHADLFDEDGHLKATEHLGPHSLRSLILGMVIEERILECVTAAERLLAHVLQLSKCRTREHLWLPTGPRYALSWLSNGFRGVPLSMPFLGADEDSQTGKQDAAAIYRSLRINRGCRTSGKSGFPIRAIRHAFRWLTNPAGVYALRMVAVTIATAIPASLPSTAGFFYREKGLWGVITAQIGVLVYMADFLFSLLGRVAGTVVGGLLGMAAWYIGSGHGPGNPYGLATITAVITLGLVWCRLFLPHSLTGTTVMTGITFVLVLGFSYDATHLQAYGLPGYGYEAFYKRVVTVLLGLVAAFIVQIFPRPPTASQHVRKSLSNTIGTLSDNYTLLLSRWNRDSPISGNCAMDQLSLEVAERLLSLQEPIRVLKFEINMDLFSRQALRLTHGLCQDMNHALANLLSLSGTLPLDLQEHLVRTVGILDEQNIAAVTTVLAVIQQALKAGDPLPGHLPTPFLGRYYETKGQFTELSTALVRNDNYRRYCVAVSSYLKFLSAVDDLVIVLKGALGESHVVDRWEGQTLA